MATEAPGNSRTMIAAADLSGQQYRGLRADATDKALVAQLGGANFAGVLQNAPILGRAATVVTTGRTKMVAGAAITLPARVTTDANGRAILATTGQQIIGRAVNAAAAAGIIVEIDLDISGGVA